jgi:hypothetical protein
MQEQAVRAQISLAWQMADTERNFPVQNWSFDYSVAGANASSILPGAAPAWS